MRLLIETESNDQYRLLPSEPDLPCDLIVEDRAYKLRLVGSTDDKGLAGCRLLLGDVNQGAGRYERVGEVSWQWEVRDYVGQVTVGVVRDDGVPLLPVQEVIVDPNRSKLTREQFATMVNDISAEATIAYSLSPATQRVELGQRRQSFSLAQLEYIRQQIEPLRRAVEAISHRPRRILISEDKVVDLARARAPDDRSIAWLLDRPGELVPVDEANTPAGARGLRRLMGGYVPERLQVSRRIVTCDVYENQLVKHFLHHLNVVLRHTQDRLAEAADTSNQQLDERVIRLARRRLDKLKGYFRILYNLSELDFLREVGPLRHLKPVTSVLRKDPLYARFYSLYRQFDQAITPFDGLPFQLSLEKTWQLYEYWCFFQVVAALRHLVGGELQFDARSLLERHPDRVSMRLPQATITINRRLQIHFQKSYGYYGWNLAGKRTTVGTYSHEMRPDISIEVKGDDDQIQQIIVLDPKYRVSSPSLNQAMNDLHRYKDAIVGPDRRRLITTALALCPSASKDVHRYFQEDYIQTHGLGALALCPGTVGGVELLTSRLDHILQTVS